MGLSQLCSCCRLHCLCLRDVHACCLLLLAHLLCSSWSPLFHPSLLGWRGSSSSFFCLLLSLAPYPSVLQCLSSSSSWNHSFCCLLQRTLLHRWCFSLHEWLLSFAGCFLLAADGIASVAVAMFELLETSRSVGFSCKDFFKFS